MRLRASVYGAKSVRLLGIFTNETDIQLYTGHFLNGTLISKQGGVYGYRTGFSLET